GEVLDADGIERQVDVKRELARLDDPEVQAFLRHPSPLGASLFTGGDEPFNPTRPLVRYSRPAIEARLSPELRRYLWRRLDAVRGKLEHCYSSSLMRAPEIHVKKRVRLRADESGRLIVEDQGEIPLGDAQGDACVARAFAQASVARPELEAVEIDLKISFFIQPARYIQRSYLEGGGGIGDALHEYASDRGVTRGAER